MATSPRLVSRPERIESVPAAEGARDLYERYYDRVLGYCLYQLGSREEAEDAAQTTFLWAFRALRRGVVPRAEDSWLFTIAKNSCRARHRARGRRRLREVVSDPHVLADISPALSRQHDELIGLDEALARMPELQRQALLLREWKGLSYREIAAELELSGAAVETLIFRARRSLAELLNGKPAPKRARRFAFDVGSIGVALKSALGGASLGKLAAGVAAAVVVATAVPGSTEERVPPAQGPAPAAIPTMPVEKVVGTKARSAPQLAPKPERESKAKPKPTGTGKETPSASTTPVETAPSSSTPPPALGQQVDDTVAALPLSGLTDPLPVDTVTDVVDQTLEDVDSTIDEAGATVDEVLKDVNDLLP